jgi:prevent-host-death family protein
VHNLAAIGMRSYPLHEARSKLSSLIARALKGQPQRITRHGKEAVVIISEKDWNARPKSAPTLADLFIKTLGADAQGFRDVIERPTWAKDERALGDEFAD